jgi:hypothetical protein
VLLRELCEAPGDALAERLFRADCRALYVRHALWRDAARASEAMGLPLAGDYKRCATRLAGVSATGAVCVRDVNMIYGNSYQDDSRSSLGLRVRCPSCSPVCALCAVRCGDVQLLRESVFIAGLLPACLSLRCAQTLHLPSARVTTRAVDSSRFLTHVPAPVPVPHAPSLALQLSQPVRRAVVSLCSAVHALSPDLHAYTDFFLRLRRAGFGRN